MSDTKTLRLMFPQWQGGGNPDYVLGAKLLAWLAPPAANHLEVEVPVSLSSTEALQIESGILARAALLRQLDAARDIIDQHRPDRIIVFGGDCLMDQAPFSYLSGLYGEEFGVLWIDAHPDVATPHDRDRGHTMVLGNLLGYGDAEFAAQVPTPLEPKRVMFAGLGKLLPQEASFIAEHGIRTAAPETLRAGVEPIITWIQEAGIRHLAIHLDLDVLDPELFGGVSFAKPGLDMETRSAMRSGSMSFEQIANILSAVSQEADVVGLGFAEHIPWDAINLRNLMAGIPIFQA